MKHTFYLLLSTIIFLNSFSQNKSITNNNATKESYTFSIVSSTDHNQKISYAFISLLGTNYSTISDGNGTFSIPDSILNTERSSIITSIGYKRSEISLSKAKLKKEYLISLEEEASNHSDGVILRNPKTKYYNFKIKVTDENDKPINVMYYINDQVSDKKLGLESGFTISNICKDTKKIIIECSGYKSIIINLERKKYKKNITLNLFNEFKMQKQ